MPADASTRALRERAQRAIDVGELPATLKAPRLQRGLGSGAQCAVCQLPIDSGQSQIQLEAGLREGPCLHVDCYNAWRWVCEELTAQVPVLRN